MKCNSLAVLILSTAKIKKRKRNMKYKELINKMTLEEKASLMSGKDFWQTQEIDRLGIKNMFLADGPHGIRKQTAAADHLGLNPSNPATCFPTAATIAKTPTTPPDTIFVTPFFEKRPSL